MVHSPTLLNHLLRRLDERSPIYVLLVRIIITIAVELPLLRSRHGCGVIGEEIERREIVVQVKVATAFYM